MPFYDGIVIKAHLDYLQGACLQFGLANHYINKRKQNF